MSVLFAVPASAVSPISGDNRSSPVAGASNGELANSELINVAPNCQAHRSAASSLALLLASARNRGVSLEMNECYRSLSEQIAVAKRWTNIGNSACAARVTTDPSGVVKGTSIHGWGKAADFDLNGAGFSAPGYKYLKSAAYAYGWNHPGWAEPGGSPCPEAWHWEWVGDGGTLGADAIRADVVGLIPSKDDGGYATVTGLGALGITGNAPNYGSAESIALNWVIVGASATASGDGYWLVASDGGVFSFGDAQFYGSTGAMKLNQPIVGMAPTPSGNGYWLVASDGGVFSFGDAQFYGSTGAMRLNKPVVGMAATPSGNGYWLVASDGGIFSYGDAQFYGSTGGMQINQPISAMTSSVNGNGYWLVASDGGVFSFGDVEFYGSAGGASPVQPVVSINRKNSGQGYWITVANGEVLSYGSP